MINRKILLFILFFISLGSYASEQAKIETLLKQSNLYDYSGVAQNEWVLVQFWNPFCLPCGEEVKVLNKYLTQSETRSKKIKIVGVPFGAREQEILKFIEHFKPNYTQWRPDTKLSSFLQKKRTVPWTLLLDQKRQLITQWYGSTELNELSKKINRYIK